MDTQRESGLGARRVLEALDAALLPANVHDAVAMTRDYVDRVHACADALPFHAIEPLRQLTGILRHLERQPAHDGAAWAAVRPELIRHVILLDDALTRDARISRGG